MPLFDKLLIDENYEATALLGLCDVTLNGKKFQSERIRLDLDKGVVRIEAAKFAPHKVPLGKPLGNDFIVSNIKIQSRGNLLTAEELEYDFISSIGGAH